ncbi:annexin A3-like isoform X2 [Oncorhynchus tshawytscha]|uniref:annexin A3-like isoform X2 n=1 Tax=Oncorhynchus tshawytscha TaxID=74940 RepID=UPI001C3DB161|nr:annexin A3-like isoform X2 [Oncorhynchus tshawytscha]
MATSWTGERGSIKPKADFNAKDDAVALRKAMKGLGTNEKTLIDVLTQRSSGQRQLICKAYQEEAPGKTLVEDLEGDNYGHFEDLLVALVTPPVIYDCQEVTKAMKGVGTKDSVLIEIFATRSNKQIKEISDAYLKQTEKKLTLDLKKETSGEFAKAILILAEGKRDENTHVDAAKAKEDAKTLYNAGEKKWGTDESKFIDILCQRSIPQLRQMKCVKNVPAYLAERLHQGMKGGGTDECTLNRIMVSRSEIDMLDIRAEFKKLYSYSLHSAIESDTSDFYGDCLKKICGGDD